MKRSITNGVSENYSEGDKIWIYDAIDGEVQDVKSGEPVFYKKTGEPKMIPNRILKVKELWNKDENKMHYVGRVYKTTEILKNVLDMTQFPKYTLKSKQKELKDLTNG